MDSRLLVQAPANLLVCSEMFFLFCVKQSPILTGYVPFIILIIYSHRKGHCTGGLGSDN